MLSIIENTIPGTSVMAIGALSLGLYSTVLVGKYLNWTHRNSQLKARAKKVLDDRNAKTYEFKEVKNEDLILSLDVTQLKEHLLSGSFTSVDLVNVYAKRCYSIGRELCLITEENYEEALREAQIKDSERE